MANTVKNTFLNERLNKRVTVFLNNGYQLKGYLKKFDDSALVIETHQYSNNMGDLQEIMVNDSQYTSVI